MKALKRLLITAAFSLYGLTTVVLLLQFIGAAK